MNRPRTPETRIPISLPVVTPDGGEPGVTKNISEGGFFLITKRRYPIGEHVELRFKYGDLELGVTGRVTHLQADGAGFAFVDASDRLRDLVRELIDEILVQTSMDDDTNPRYALRQKVSWSRGDSERLQAVIRDLSGSGAYLDSDVSVSVGETIILYLPGYVATDEERASEVRGTEANVVHESEGGFGVRFLNPSAEFRMAAERLMSALAVLNPK
ncbi:MAG: PilZ domain-containing protein [Myxococcota bacterium]